MRGGTELKQIKVPSMQIAMGMYVSALDRPWSESPFLMQGFCVTSPKVLAKLQELCEYVMVDSTKSIGEVDQKLDTAPVAPKFDTSTSSEPVRKSSKPLPINKEKYVRRPVMTTADVATARQSYQNVQKSIGSVFKGVSASSSVDAKSIEQASNSLVNSAVRYPSALSWLALMQKRSDKVYNHAMRASTWALLCGRHIGIEEAELKYLTLAILLKDIGNLKSNAGQVKVNTEGMTREEAAIAKTVALVKQSTKSEKVISIIETYREKFNGTGKPKGLVGEEIPLLARIASIAIAYDLLLNPVRAERAALSPSEASRYIYAQRGRAFQDELAVQFIEALGTYPLGTLLQLDSGEIGVVVDHDEKARLKPTIMVVADEFGKPIEDWRIIKLSQASTAEGKDDEKPAITKVMRDLSADNLDLDMQKIQDKYQELRTDDPKKGKSNSGLLSKLLRR
jgi:HD-GYP domain-containing protein (c-di-GMP phosphodiesterase class II)